MEQYTAEQKPHTLESLSRDALNIKYHRDPLLDRAVNSINRLAETVELQRRQIVRLEAQLNEMRNHVQTLKK